MQYEKLLIDDRGSTHPRKNQYIIDLIRSREEGQAKPDKNNHPYIKEEARLKDEEKKLLDKYRTEISSDTSYNNKKLAELNKDLYVAEKMLPFYEANQDFSYDFELKYKLAKIRASQIPQILRHDAYLKSEIESKNDLLSKLSTSDKENDKKLVEEAKAKANHSYEKSLATLKESYDKNLISKDAFNKGKKQYKLRNKDDILRAEYLDREFALNDEIKSLNYKLKNDLTKSIRRLEGDTSEARRRTPIEVLKITAWKSIVSIPFPGLGQILNGQIPKGILLLLATVLIYTLFIPYVLGFGNYQGTGISGLITLANDGKRLDRSLIFMIEGIVALILLFLSVLTIYLSFRDARKTELREMRGIRANNWFETRKYLRTDGFPFMVITPVSILILFIVLVPIFTTILISFTNMNPNNQNKFQWVGPANYSSIVMGQGIAGRAFWHILGWTLIWTIGGTTLQIVIGFLLALIINNPRIKGKKFFRTVYLLPWAIPAFVTIMFFSLMLSKNGIFANSLESIMGRPIDVKNSATATRIAIILLQGWLGHSYMFLITNGALQSIPADLYEAASIDGASSLKRMTKITIPFVMYQLAPLVVNQYVGNFNNFNIIYLFNGGGPFNPEIYGNLAGSTDILISYIYKLTIENQYQAIGAAITIFISIFLIIISYFGYRKSSVIGD